MTSNQAFGGMSKLNATEWRACCSIWLLLVFGLCFWGGADTRGLFGYRLGFAFACLPWFLPPRRPHRVITSFKPAPWVLPFVLLLLVYALRWLNAWWSLPAAQLAPGQFWFDGTAPWKSMPSTIFREDAERAFWQVAYAGMTAGCVHWGLGRRRAVRMLLRGVVYLALVIGLWGLAEKWVGQTAYYGRVEVSRAFFGPFFYLNHGGQFLYMAFACAGGLLLASQSKTQRSMPRQTALYLAALVLCSVALFAVLSRAGLGCWPLGLG